MKNKFLRGFLLVIGIVFVGIVGTKLYFNYQLRIIDENNELIAQTQYIANALRLQKELHQKGVELSSSYSEIIEERAKKIVKIKEFEQLEVTRIGEMLYIADILGDNEKSRFRNLLNEYYNSDKKIFSQYPYNENISDEARNEHLDVFLTISMYNELDDTELLKEYDIEEGLANWFMENYKDEEEESNVTSIIWLLYDNDKGKLKSLDRNIVCDLVKKEIEDVESSYKETSKDCMTALFCADELHAYYTYFEENDKYEGMVDKIYRKIEDEAGLEYSEDDSTFLIFFRMLVEDVDRVVENQYIADNISDLLIKNYYGSVEEN